MNNLANAITCLRILCSLFILFTNPFTLLFWVLYMCCGISDILDGVIARSMKIESEIGAKLDSIADLTFIITMIFVFLPILHLPRWIWLWIIIIAVIRMLSYLFGFIKYHTFASLHTYTNKITGLLLFTTPVLYILFGVNVTGVILCVSALLSALEELLITIKSKELDRNIKSIFSIKL
ncbi:CDP-alcohol phosphatidyltransferase family protein [Terrisporobacter petrolearius]|uniref:CDP-alcohol phosphatidyltransferase family protein n=1 Tax=Terrisporobacter petrolearius TaxID=1460447 RepID=UPI001D16AFDB|nr:CDP-alcohol phosphatidyltransferase family protein [Terrisporobacter petrolearius]